MARSHHLLLSGAPELWGRAAGGAGETSARAAGRGDPARGAIAGVVALDEADDRGGVLRAAGVARQLDCGGELLVDFEVGAALARLGRSLHRVARDRGADGAVVAGRGAGLTEQAPASERAWVGDRVAGDRQVHGRIALALEEADPGLVLVLEEAVAGDRERLSDRALGEDADVVALRPRIRRRRGADRVPVHGPGQRARGAVLVDRDAGEDRI